MINIFGLRIKIGLPEYNPSAAADRSMIEDGLYQSIPDISGKDCLWKLLKEYDFKTVLDLGAGEGKHCKVFVENGKKVTAMVGYDAERFDNRIKNDVRFIVSDYLKHDSDEKFDCIWAAHILEHQLNIGLFLNKVYEDLKEGGIFAVTVPPCELFAGGGHINYFSPGYLVYHLLMAGFDLREMRLKPYGYNLSVICAKNSQFKPAKNNFTECLITRYGALPQYVVDSIERFKKDNPMYNGKFVNGTHERIELDLEYKW
jgi:SAM-dependent methyltransferase